MKIEPNNSASAITTNKPSKPLSAKANDTSSSVKSDKADLDTMRISMQQWFAKAGIRTQVNNPEERDAGRRVALHQHLKAQRKMHNLETILALALDFCLEQGKADGLDPDWFFSFITMAEEIHAPAMQELWAKIFSVEISRPGTFSLRTLQTLKNLTHKDAQMFSVAVSLSSKKKGENSPKLIFGYHQKPSVLSFLGLKKNHQLNLAEFSLAYPDLLSLMEMGLIYNSEIESGELNPSTRIQWRCGNHLVHLAARTRGLTLNYYKFTATGAELCKLVSGQTNIKYIETLKSVLSSGFEIT
jgi:uncharacterized repeat protein (TIGR03899 family)